MNRPKGALSQKYITGLKRLRVQPVLYAVRNTEPIELLRNSSYHSGFHLLWRYKTGYYFTNFFHAWAYCERLKLEHKHD